MMAKQATAETRRTYHAGFFDKMESEGNTGTVVVKAEVVVNIGREDGGEGVVVMLGSSIHASTEYGGVIARSGGGLSSVFQQGNSYLGTTTG